MDYTDSQLIDMIGEPSGEAKEVLYNRYKNLIDYSVKKYIKAANVLGIDYSDLHQEALVGFSDSLNNYQDNKDTTLPTFIRLCVERRLQVCIIKAGRLKNKVMNSYLSLEDTTGDKVALMHILSDNNANDPLEKMSKEEGYQELVKRIKNNLSDTEIEVYSLMITGLGYKEIALKLNKEPKQIDNAIQRIKIKVKKILDER